MDQQISLIAKLAVGGSQRIAVQVAVLVPGDVEIGRLRKVLVEAVAQAHAALDELAAEDGRAFALVPQDLYNDGTADFPRKVCKSAGIMVGRHCNCNCNCNCCCDFGVILVALAW